MLKEKSNKISHGLQVVLVPLFYFKYYCSLNQPIRPISTFIKFVVTQGSPINTVGLQRSLEDMEWSDDLQPGDNDDEIS